MNNQSDVEIQRLYDTLQIRSDRLENSPRPYNTSAQFEKCGITVDIPTTVSNATTISTSRHSVDGIGRD